MVKSEVVEEKKDCFCGLPSENHPTCALCGIRVGHKHLEDRLGREVIGKAVCQSCLGWAKKNKSERVALFVKLGPGYVREGV